MGISAHEGNGNNSGSDAGRGQALDEEDGPIFEAGCITETLSASTIVDYVEESMREEALHSTT